VKNAETVSQKIARAFGEYPSWRQSEADLRELRKAATFAIYAAVDDPDTVTGIVENLLSKPMVATGGSK